MSHLPPYPFQDVVCPTLSSSPPLSETSAWPPIKAFKLYTLIFVLPKTPEGSAQKVLLGLKQRGAFTGIWNGFGGKVDPTDDSVLSSAVRELKEEAGIDATDMRYRGRIVFGGAPEEVSIDMRLYSCMEWSGQLTASEEMGMPTWFSTALPDPSPLPTPPASSSSSRVSSPPPTTARPSDLPPLPSPMHSNSYIYLPYFFSGKSILARFDYGTLTEEGGTGTWKAPKAWWIGEFEEGGSSGTLSEWP